VAGSFRIYSAAASSTQVSLMNGRLLDAGLDMPRCGVGAVMAFLLVVVFATTIMSALVRRFFSDPQPLPPAERGLAVAPQAPDQRVLRVITAAIARPRGDKNQ